MISQILLPMNGSEMGQNALEYALENHPEADITVLHVVGVPSSMGGATTALALEENLEAATDERAADVFDSAQSLADAYDVDIRTEVELGYLARAILKRAADFDVIIIGTHGCSLADRLFVGNVAQKVFRRSPIPVITVR